MQCTLRLFLLAAAVTGFFAIIACQPVAAATHSFHYLDPADFRAANLLPAPAAKGSDVEKAELAEVRALVALASPARMQAAREDDTHEDPSIFDSTIGGGFEASKLPATWELLKIVHEEAEAAVNPAKEFFARTRPWGVDPTLPHCDAGMAAKPTRSYPSGHSILGFSVGLVLARLIPEKAPLILARAQDYALSREICGVHFPGDTEASHVLGTLVADRLLAAPALRDKIEAARAELRAAHVTAQ
jgi:acid phosphatase (class A)